MSIPQFNLEWLGANLIVSGCLDFSYTPFSLRLQADNGTALIVDMPNYTSHQIGVTMEHDMLGHGNPLEVFAKGQRVVTAWLDLLKQLTQGYKMRLHSPK